MSVEGDAGDGVDRAFFGTLVASSAAERVPNPSFHQPWQSRQQLLQHNELRQLLRAMPSNDQKPFCEEGHRPFVPSGHRCLSSRTPDANVAEVRDMAVQRRPNDRADPQSLPQRRAAMTTCVSPARQIREVHVLPNGNTLIAQHLQFMEVTPDKKVLWIKHGYGYGSARR